MFRAGGNRSPLLGFGLELSEEDGTLGDIVLFRRAVVAQGSPQGKAGRSEDCYVGINVYVPPHRDRLRCVVKRGVAHGVLAAFGFHHTSGLLKELFRTGGLFRVRCGEDEALAMRDLLAESLPYIDVRMVRPRATTRRVA